MDKKALMRFRWRIGVFLFLALGFMNQAGYAGQVERLEFRIETASLPRPAQLAVYLPPGYDPDRDEPYPLLILLHGQGMDLSTWDELGLAKALNAYATSDESDPYIIVTILETDNLIDHRSSDFGRFILERILPFAERNFNCGGDRDRRAIGGISRGALWAAELAFRAPDTFQHVGLHSIPAAPFYDAEFHRLVTTAKDAELSFNVLFDIGAEDPYLPKSRAMADLLTNEKIPLDEWIQAGDHSNSYWQSRLPDYLDWYGRSFINAR